MRIEYNENELLSNVNPIFYMGDFTVCDSNWHYENIKIGFEKFYYIVKGECIIEVDDVKYTAKAGQLFFLPSKSKQSLYTENNQTVEKYWFHCNLSCGNKNFTDLIKLPIFINVKNEKCVTSLFQNVLSKSSDSTLTSKIEQKADILKILAFYIKHSAFSEKNIIFDKQIAYVISYIENNLDKPLSLKELSSMVNFQPNYFIRFFKKVTGYPPHEFIQKKRIDTAQKMLLDENLSIQEIALKVGFSDSHYFSRYFKKVTGFTPKYYRIYSKE